jgi:hypothetical protein
MTEGYHREETVVTEGFVILDGRGRIWLDQLFFDEDGANMTAARCCSAECSIHPAREIMWQDYRPGYRLPVPRRQIILSGNEA